MDWTSDGILLSARPHGESAAIIEVLTADHGRHAGLVHGGQGRRLSPVLQPGNQLRLAWRARLEDQLGTFGVDTLRDRAGQLMEDRRSLAGLSAVTGLLRYALPERLPLPGVMDATAALLDLMAVTPSWPVAYLRWEMGLLDTLGYGLSLGVCAVTGSRDDLAYVSPRTGRAVSRKGAGDWADRLLPLPYCMLGQGPASDAEIAQALGTTGHFLMHHVTPQWQGQPFPAGRQRLIDLLLRKAAQPGAAGAVPRSPQA